MSHSLTVYCIMASRWDIFLQEDTFSQQVELHTVVCCNESGCKKSLPATTMEEKVRRLKMERNRPAQKDMPRQLPHRMKLKKPRQELPQKDMPRKELKKQMKKKKKPARLSTTLLRSAAEISGAIMRSFVEYKTTKATLKIDEPDPIFDENVESEDMWQALYNEEAAYEKMVKERQY